MKKCAACGKGAEHLYAGNLCITCFDKLQAGRLSREANSMESLHKCTRCKAFVQADASRCQQCGASLAGADSVESDEPKASAPPRTKHQQGIIEAVIGFVSLIAVAASFTRATEAEINLWIVLMGFSGFCLGHGLWLLFGDPAQTQQSSPSQTPIGPVDSTAPIEDRLRQLEDLRSKGLITESQYEKKKQEIIAAI